MLVTARARRATRPAGVALALLVAALVLPAASWSPLRSTARADTTAASELEAPDFASEVYADPWDYSNPEDQNTDMMFNARSISISGGKLNFDATGGTSLAPVVSVPGSIANGRDGAALSIDTSRYKRFSFRMDQGSSGVGALYYFTCREMIPTCAGGVTFSITPGDHVYDLALDGPSTIGVNQPWTGRKVAMLMIPTISLGSAHTHVSIDWMRLYAPTAGRPHAAYPPGDHGDYVVRPLPRPVVDSPDPDEGIDLAAVQRGRSWVFTDPAAAAGVVLNNVKNVSYGARGLTATNAPPDQQDPQVVLPIQPFDANLWHHLSFDYTYDGPFDLRDAPGGGKMSRLIWNVAGSSTPQDGDDIVTWAGDNNHPISIDLTSSPTPVLDANSRAPQLGWAGRTITMLRFDPNEDPGTATWHLKSLHLRQDPAASGSTTVRFHDDAWVPGTTADVLVGTGVPGSPYTTVADGVAVHDGSNAVPFALGSLPSGAYHVQVVLHHPAGGLAWAFSRTVVRMTAVSGNPSGSLDTVRRAPGGVSVSGWATDPGAGDGLGVRVLVDGQRSVATTTDEVRRDVQASVPGAGPSTGYTRYVPVPAGTHSVCTVAVNVGSGSDTQLGCRQVVVTGTALGSFDSAVAVPGGLRVSGWALDPDVSAPIAVHVYVGASGQPVRADDPRSDVAAAWPGYGAPHGFSDVVALPPGTYTVCAYAIGTAGGDTGVLGCRSVAVGMSAPVGSLDTVTRVAAGVRVRGWALDPDTTSSTLVAVYVGAAGTPTIANTVRTDVGAAFPGFGARHGFDVTVPAPAGSSVCAYALDDRGVANRLVGCRVA